jgi:tRNA uridine 5-carboxymethylaminomethyl modification enzyme
MFTSRAEFRLHLRIDNADRRLTPHGRRVGLISDDAWQDFQSKQDRLGNLKTLLERTKLTAAMLETFISCHSDMSCHSEERSDEEPAVVATATARDWTSALGQSYAQLLKRPEITIEQLAPVLRKLEPSFFERDQEHIQVNSVHSVTALSSEVRNELKSVETEIKYEGYLLQQQRAMERMKKSEQRSIPGWFDYHSVSGLSREMQEKLSHVQPRTLAQASRIPGVTPAAVSLVNVYIEIQARRRQQAAAI